MDPWDIPYDMHINERLRLYKGYPNTPEIRKFILMDCYRWETEAGQYHHDWKIVDDGRGELTVEMGEINDTRWKNGHNSQFIKPDRRDSVETVTNKYFLVHIPECNQWTMYQDNEVNSELDKVFHSDAEQASFEQYWIYLESTREDFAFAVGSDRIRKAKKDANI